MSCHRRGWHGDPDGALQSPAPSRTAICSWCLPLLGWEIKGLIALWGNFEPWGQPHRDMNFRGDRSSGLRRESLQEGPQSRPSRGDTDPGGVSEEQFEGSTQLLWSSVGLEEPGGGAPKLSTSGWLSLCRCLMVKGWGGAGQRRFLPATYKWAAGRYHPAQPKDWTRSHICICKPGQGSKHNGQRGWS